MDRLLHRDVNASSDEEVQADAEPNETVHPRSRVTVDNAAFTARFAAAAGAVSTGSTPDPYVAQRRLQQNLRSLQQSQKNNLNPTIAAVRPVDGNLFHWRAVLAGPEDTPWAGALLKLDLQFPPDYPLSPPAVRFRTPGLSHPNVYVLSGEICLDVLKSKWSPALDVEALLLSIASLLAEPNPASPANAEAARLWVQNRADYEQRTRAFAASTLEQGFSDLDEEEEEEEEEEKGKKK